MAKDVTDQRLSYFTILWALVAFMEQMRHNQKWFFMPTDHLFIIAIIFALCFPNTLGLAFLAGAGLVQLFLATTNSLNNIAFEVLIHATILSVIGLSFINRKTWGFGQKDIYLKLAPLIRLSVVIFYFFSFFTKLNLDFLDPQVSCAVRAVDTFLKQWFGISGASWPKSAAIWATLTIEFVLPLMLIFKKTRDTAIIFGLCFHLILGFMVRVWGFSMLMCALYFVFLSDGSFAVIEHWGEKFKKKVQKILPSTGTRILAVAMAVYGSLLFNVFLHTHKAFKHPPFIVQESYVYMFCIWLVLCSLVAFVFIKSIVASPTVKGPDEKGYFLPRPAFLLVLIVPLLINGLGPFLGLRTKGCITIFSNLRTLGPRPNHLILGPSFVVFEQGLVKVLGADHPSFLNYIQSQHMLTEYEFRRLANSIKGSFYVQCLYQGKAATVHKTDAGPNDHPLLRPIPWLVQRVIGFNRVDELERCRCAEGLQGLFSERMRSVL